MSRLESTHPYTDFIVSGPYLSTKTNRNVAMLKPLNGGELTSTPYARYLLAIKIGRFLEPHEYADHIDNNQLNDVPDNLQILTATENNIKSRKNRGISGHQYVLLMCPVCGEVFERMKNSTFLCKPKQKYAICTPRCRGLLSTKGIQFYGPYIIEFFRKTEE